ncbi:BlaI/MecI/CopY family transcriptional regulator [Sphingoaurantiacus capsulatus]|uniref:BlaI/MecI/CopY family transcriptional regulator n=1 Tax=Sphingoaurantiacus capsulatus TaxID=1771310 RepID=A0ABV7XA03_9SPHN
MLEKLPPREREIVDLLYTQGERTVADVCAALPDTLTASAVRAMLTRLEAKGYVSRTPSDRGFLYSPSVPEAKAKQSALSQLVRTFFGGSPVGAATALLGMSAKLDDAELAELERSIAAARKARQEKK